MKMSAANEKKSMASADAVNMMMIMKVVNDYVLSFLEMSMTPEDKKKFSRVWMEKPMQNPLENILESSIAKMLLEKNVIEVISCETQTEAVEMSNVEIQTETENETTENSKEEETKPKKGRPKKTKQASNVKRPCSAYIFFCKERRKTLMSEGYKSSEATKLCGEEWKLIKTDKELSAPWFELAEEDKLRYEVEIELERNDEGVKEPEKKKRRQTKKKTDKKNDENIDEKEDNDNEATNEANDTSKKTKRPPRKTAFSLYCHDRRPMIKKSNPKMTNSEILSELKEWWETEDTKEQERFEEMAFKKNKESADSLGISYSEFMIQKKPGRKAKANDAEQPNNQEATRSETDNEDTTETNDENMNKKKKQVRKPRMKKTKQTNEDIEAFKIFTAEVLDTISSQYPDETKPAHLRRIGTMWKNMPLEAKAKYYSNENENDEE